MSRPSSYTEEIGERICVELSRDRSMRAICKDEGMPDRRTVERWMESDPVFAAKCARARQSQADYVFDDIKRIEVKTERGLIDPAAARAILSSKQWRADKLSPKKYGTRTTLAGDPDAPLSGLSEAQVEQRLAELLAKRTG